MQIIPLHTIPLCVNYMHQHIVLLAAASLRSTLRICYRTGLRGGEIGFEVILIQGRLECASSSWPGHKDKMKLFALLAMVAFVATADKDDDDHGKNAVSLTEKGFKVRSIGP